MFLQDLETFYADKPGERTPGGTKGQLLTFAELISSGLNGVPSKFLINKQKLSMGTKHRQVSKQTN